jgi:hypothetical protein
MKEYRNSKGKYHRLDGPAIERSDGYKAWYVNGLRHCINGPAVEHSNGDKEWYLNGKYHRLDGDESLEQFMTFLKYKKTLQDIYNEVDH